MLRIIILYFTVIIAVNCFHDDAIFEEEDIYQQALPPPVPSTGLTIFGTKWCGPGNTSTSYDDLGSQIETDKCCRAHDHCAEIIESNSNLHGLTNPDMFPRLTCQCEQEFMNCLQKAGSTVANYLGSVYFGFRAKCFRHDHPVVECKQYQGAGTFTEKRCVRYHFDRSKSKTWQYFDVPFYLKKN